MCLLASLGMSNALRDPLNSWQLMCHLDKRAPCAPILDDPQEFSHRIYRDDQSPPLSFVDRKERCTYVVDTSHILIVLSRLHEMI